MKNDVEQQGRAQRKARALRHQVRQHPLGPARLARDAPPVPERAQGRASCRHPGIDRRRGLRPRSAESPGTEAHALGTKSLGMGTSSLADVKAWVEACACENIAHLMRLLCPDCSASGPCYHRAPAPASLEDLCAWCPNLGCRGTQS